MPTFNYLDEKRFYPPALILGHFYACVVGSKIRFSSSISRNYFLLSSEWKNDISKRIWLIMTSVYKHGVKDNHFFQDQYLQPQQYNIMKVSPRCLRLLLELVKLTSHFICQQPAGGQTCCLDTVFLHVETLLSPTQNQDCGTDLRL